MLFTMLPFGAVSVNYSKYVQLHLEIALNLGMSRADRYPNRFSKTSCGFVLDIGFSSKEHQGV